jgi:hypothetical protein
MLLKSLKKTLIMAALNQQKRVEKGKKKIKIMNKNVNP